MRVVEARAWDSHKEAGRQASRRAGRQAAGKKANERASQQATNQPGISQSLRCPRVHMCAGHEVALLVVRCVRAWLPSPPHTGVAALPSVGLLGGRRCRYACGGARRCHIDRGANERANEPPRHLCPRNTAPSLALSFSFFHFLPLFPLFPPISLPRHFFSDPLPLFVPFGSFPFVLAILHGASRTLLAPSLSHPRVPATSKRCKAPRHLTDSALPTSSRIPRTLHAPRIASRPMPDYGACPFERSSRGSRALEQAGHLHEPYRRFLSISRCPPRHAISRSILPRLSCYRESLLHL